jgi:hypothetical protein
MQFNEWRHDAETTAKFNTGMVDHLADIEANMKNGDYVWSPETLGAANKMISGYAGVWDPKQPYTANLGKTFLTLGASYSLDKATNDGLTKYVDQVYSSNPSHYANGIYDVWTEVKNHGMSDDQIKDMAHSIWETHYAANAVTSGDDYFSEDKIATRLRALYPVRAEKEVKFQTNQFSNAGGEEQTYDATAINPEAVPVEFAGAANGVLTYDGQTLTKPVTLNVPTATAVIDPATGKPVDVAGNAKVQIGKTFNVLTDKNGNILSRTDYAAALQTPAIIDQNGWKYQTYASGTIDLGTSSTSSTSQKGRTSTTTGTSDKNIQTVWIPVDGIKNGLTTFNPDGTYKKGVRTDIQENNANQRNQQLKSAAQAPAANQQQQTTPAPHGQTVQQNGVTYNWNGKEYVPQQ